MTDITPDDVRKWLGEIPELVALLPDAAVTRTQDSNGGGRPVPSSRPPLKVEVVHLLDRREKYSWLDGSMAWCDPDRMGVLPYLDGWVHDLEATALDGDDVFDIAPSSTPPRPTPETPTVAGCCEWLAAILEYAAGLPQWFEFADGIRTTHRNLLAATAVVRDRERPVRCTYCGVGTLQRHGTEALWQCEACGHQVTVQAVTLRQAASIIPGVNVRTLQRWALRPGLLKPVADGPRKRLFDLGQIRALVAENRLRGGA